MFRPGSMILLAFLVTSSKGNFQCPVCQQTDIDNFCTIDDCGHNVCIMCITKIVCSTNLTCPTCSDAIKGVLGTVKYEMELYILKDIIKKNKVADNRIIARCLLPPWQAADLKMLQDVKAIEDSYKSMSSAVIQKIRSNVDGYTFVEDVKERRNFFRTRYNDNDRELITLQEYYTRNNYDPSSEFQRRASVYWLQSDDSSDSDV
ncbi:uncharacterized protein LOC126899885 [Daktulosphaira vitifoliae]|uniref:uncharacterized protein LOC126899885 n=1 Tax=Daktulosphaira vitifoliae TaxID=58002 RepID=UPI0021AA33A3|nr:uncharacterized protein LOC126899885 [Daktulosphaira vitifoliae]